MCIQGNCVNESPQQLLPSAESIVDETGLAESENAIEVTTKAVDGQFGSWSQWSACSSECLIGSSLSVVGIKISTRKCNSPSPSNGGKFCDGSDKRIRLCDASKVNDEGNNLHLKVETNLNFFLFLFLFFLHL